MAEDSDSLVEGREFRVVNVPSGGRILAKPTVLVVDDNAALNQAMKLHFSIRGWDVESALTLQEAHQRLSSQPSPSLIVLDLMLPDGGGEMILRRVRDEGRPSFVAIVSGENDVDYLRTVERMGPDAMLSKPAAIDLIIEVYNQAQQT